MKKFVALLLAAMMLLAMVACGRYASVQAAADALVSGLSAGVP